MVVGRTSKRSFKRVLVVNSQSSSKRCLQATRGDVSGSKQNWKTKRVRTGMNAVLRIQDSVCVDHFLKRRLQVVVFEMRDAWSAFDVDDLVKSIM